MTYSKKRNKEKYSAKRQKMEKVTIFEIFHDNQLEKLKHLISTMNDFE